MDLCDIIRQRGSTRAFLSRDVPTQLVRDILDVARFAPSGSNTQPWQIHVVTGQARAALCTAVRHAAVHERDRHRGFYEYYPSQWKEPYLSRRRACGWGLYSLLGIQKGDRAGGLTQELKNFDFFGAPVGLFVFMDRDLGQGSLIDCGMFMQNLMIAAQTKGLATCPQAAWAPFQAVVRGQLGVSDDQILLCGIALGYADPTAPVNQYRPERLPIDDFTHFHSAGDGPST
jgi:nitroreductase